MQHLQNLEKKINVFLVIPAALKFKCPNYCHMQITCQFSPRKMAAYMSGKNWPRLRIDNEYYFTPPFVYLQLKYVF